MEATCSSEASVEFERTTQRCIPEDRTPQDVTDLGDVMPYSLVDRNQCLGRICCVPTKPYGVTSKYTIILIFTTVRTKNCIFKFTGIVSWNVYRLCYLYYFLIGYELLIIRY
jgi:hypothetical protein